MYETSTLRDPWRYRMETANIFARDEKSTLLSPKECNEHSAEENARHNQEAAAKGARKVVERVFASAQRNFRRIQVIRD